ncbi:MAG: NAD+ synthase [Elusimicrobiota bacterium]|jgi:NAD+ synthetase
MKLALAQIDTTVADLRGNIRRILAAYEAARGLGADLVAFPELAIPGYPAGDLLEDPDLIRENLRSLKVLARAAGETAMLVGYAEPNRGRGKPLFNAAALLHKGAVAAKRFKTLLPNYDVFDEARYFEPAASNLPIRFNGVKLGVTLCEDAWAPAATKGRTLYRRDPVAGLVRSGAEILLNLSASPYYRGKHGVRLSLLRRQARKHGRFFAYCNLVGGNDELVFDGGSLAFDERARLVAAGRRFEEDLVLLDTKACKPAAPRAPLGDVEEVYRALILGLRGYARKCGFKTALVGLSGGIDSALVCTLAADALGAGNVTGVLLPSRYSSAGSVEDALALARNLGVETRTLPIEPLHAASRALLGELAQDGSLTDQNLQARLRGLALMALANAQGHLLLSTGNKSECAVGYCTLYGDMAGGLALISDVPKTLVYALARFINRDGRRIPRSSIEKPPSAELKPGQTDQDDLPPYEVLDGILESYIERGRGAKTLVRGRAAKARVLETLERIDRAEYKRRQAAPGIKITEKAFGVGRRMPIARGRYR